jgi:uncharacterized protein (DUF983 family)
MLADMFFLYCFFFFLSNLGDCGECAGQDYGWSILGDVIGTIIILVITLIKSMFLNINYSLWFDLTRA